MALGSISSLGIGGGLDLQGMLDKLRAADEVAITTKKNKVTDLEARLSELDVVSSKLLTMKSHALSLSLGSNFIARTGTSSNEDVLTATALPGTTATSHSIEVTRLATKSSWQSTGLSGSGASVYVPTTQESTTGYDDTGTTSVVSADDTLILSYGSGDSKEYMHVDLTAGMTLDQVVTAINTDDENTDGLGGTLVTAETFVGTDGKNYLRIKSTAGGTGEDDRVMVTASPTELSFAAPEKTLEYHVGTDGDTISINVAADTTLTELAALINDDTDNPGITASVVDDGSGTSSYKLVLVADATGEDNRIFIDTQLDDITMSELQGAGGASLNAQIVADGITYQRQSNGGIDDVIQGLTLSLKATGTSTISVAADTESVRNDITALVEAYNELIKEIDANSSYNEDTEEWGTLAMTSVTGLEQQASSWLSSVVDTGGAIKSLFDLGLSFERDGTITLDEEVLDSALSSNFDDIMTFFAGDSDEDITGFATTLNDRLRDATTSSGSAISAEKDTAESQIERLNDDIEKSTELLDQRYDALSKRFVELDTYMSKMQSQSSYFTALTDALAGKKDE